MRAGSPWRVGTVHSSHVITTNLSHRLSHNCHTSCHIFSHTNCRKRGYKSWNVPIFHKRCKQILSLTYQTSCQKLSLKLPHKTVMTTTTAMMTVPGNNCKRGMSVTRTVMSVTTTTMSVTTTVMSVTLENDSDGASCSFSRHSQPSHQCHNYKLEEVIRKK